MGWSSPMQVTFAWINKDLIVKSRNTTTALCRLTNHVWSSTSAVSLIFRRDGDKVKECADEGEQNRNGDRVDLL